MNILQTISNFISQYANGPAIIKQALDEALSNDDIVTKIEKEFTLLMPGIVQVGSSLFPKASSSLQIVGATVATYNQTIVTWAQNALNALASSGKINLDAPLVVDGLYGPKTTAAIQAFERAYGVASSGHGVLDQLVQGALQVATATLGSATVKPAA